MTAVETPGLELRTDLLTRVAQAHDASHYLLRPEVVVRAHDRDAVVAAMREATRRGLPVTFRSGGTSLSGQASGAGVLVDTRTRFTRVEVLDGGERVRCEPGATLRLVNAHLLRHGRRLGPDPASEIACTIGGVVANNSSGMSSGTARTAYRTVEAMTVVLASGRSSTRARPTPTRACAPPSPRSTAVSRSCATACGAARRRARRSSASSR